LPDDGQESIFTEVSEFVQSFLDGYNVTLFSYGQTGSGKTYTMQGSETGPDRGIIPRLLEQVGNYKQQLEKDGWKCKMQLSFLEIYNDTIRDLLRDDGSKLLKHEIKEDADGRRIVSDLTMVSLEPTNEGKVQAKMRQAATHRAVGSTDMNSASSRSHSVFTLYLTASHPTQHQALRGMLNLVDLAGSGERVSSNASVDVRAKDASGPTKNSLSSSKASGDGRKSASLASSSNVLDDRLKERNAISKDLTALGSAIRAKADGKSHIPFRDSMLTYLLEPSFSNGGKTLMMLNLSPNKHSVKASLHSLELGAKLKTVKLGPAKSSIENVF
jgi:kinesin family protein C1